MVSSFHGTITVSDKEETAMKKKDKLRELTPALIGRYAAVLREQEKAPATVQKYVHDLTLLCGHLGGAALTKAALIGG